jgi:hypothetical protein
MTTGLQMEERVPENLKKKLALAVRSIQWSYAIFWSISARQPGYSAFLFFFFFLARKSNFFSKYNLPGFMHLGQIEFGNRYGMGTD